MVSFHFSDIEIKIEKEQRQEIEYRVVMEDRCFEMMDRLQERGGQLRPNTSALRT